MNGGRIEEKKNARSIRVQRKRQYCIKCMEHTLEVFIFFFYSTVCENWKPANGDKTVQRLSIGETMRRDRHSFKSLTNRTTKKKTTNTLNAIRTKHLSIGEQHYLRALAEPRDGHK